MIYLHFRDKIMLNACQQMAVCYDKLFYTMIDKRISNAQLMTKAGLSTNIVTRLKRNSYFSLESIEKICSVMECAVDEVLEFSLGDNGDKGQ